MDENQDYTLFEIQIGSPEQQVTNHNEGSEKALKLVPYSDDIVTKVLPDDEEVDKKDIDEKQKEEVQKHIEVNNTQKEEL